MARYENSGNVRAEILDLLNTGWSRHSRQSKTPPGSYPAALLQH
jgi:hypothetical protein